MKSYDEISKMCGPVGRAGHYDWCLVRQGEDVLAVYDKFETVRWEPAGKIIVTVPREKRNYFQRTVWGRRMTWFCGVEITDRRKSITKGLQFQFVFEGRKYWATSRIVIDSNTKTVVDYDAPEQRKIDFSKARKTNADALVILRAALATSRLMDNKLDWTEHHKLKQPDVLGSMISNQEVGAIASCFATCHSSWWDPDLSRLAKSCREEIYTNAGVFQS